MYRLHTIWKDPASAFATTEPVAEEPIKTVKTKKAIAKASNSSENLEIQRN
jgi:hypothetical protein